MSNGRSITLDDFLLLEALDSDNGARALTTATETLQRLGVPVANNKTEDPATLVVFLGIVIDTRSFELRLPLEKVQRLQALLQESHKKACTRKELESLVGHLSHAATVIRPGCTFLHQFFDLLHLHRGPNQYTRLNTGARADLVWWRCFLQKWNGSSFFPLPTPGVLGFMYIRMYQAASDVGQWRSHWGDSRPSGPSVGKGLTSRRRNWCQWWLQQHCGEAGGLDNMSAFTQITWQ